MLSEAQNPNHYLVGFSILQGRQAVHGTQSDHAKRTLPHLQETSTVPKVAPPGGPEMSLRRRKQLRFYSTLLLMFKAMLRLPFCACDIACVTTLVTTRLLRLFLLLQLLTRQRNCQNYSADGFGRWCSASCLSWHSESCSGARWLWSGAAT